MYFLFPARNNFGCGGINHEQKSVRDVEVKGKRVFVRVDFNVPVEDGKITDDTRIRETLPTIKYLIENGAKIILASHMGRPKGEFVDSMRLTTAAERLSELLGKPVAKADEAIGEAVKAKIAELGEGDVLVLENVRFYPGEEKTILNWLNNSLNWLICLLMMRLVRLTVHMHRQKVSLISYQLYPVF